MTPRDTSLEDFRQETLKAIAVSSAQKVVHHIDHGSTYIPFVVDSNTAIHSTAIGYSLQGNRLLNTGIPHWHLNFSRF